jgi:hypothetical protein
MRMLTSAAGINLCYLSHLPVLFVPPLCYLSHLPVLFVPLPVLIVPLLGLTIRNACIRKTNLLVNPLVTLPSRVEEGRRRLASLLLGMYGKEVHA